MSKHKFLLGTFIAICLLFATAIDTQARARIPVGDMEALNKSADLPDTEEFMIDEGQYADVGTLYNVFTVAFVPLWVTKEPKLVMYNEKDGKYLELPDAEMDKILKDNKLEKDKLLSLGFFVRFGGKLIALALLALIIYGMIPSKKKKESIAPQHI